MSGQVTDEQVDETRRPEPGPGFALGALATGLAGAMLVFDQQPGLNMVIFAAAAALTIGLARPGAPKLDAALFGVLVAGLVALWVLRAAEWVMFLALLAAMLAAPLALGGASSWVQAVASLLAPFRRPLAGPALVARSISSGRTSGRALSARPWLKGAALGGILVAVFAPLFLAADAVFLRIASDALPRWVPGMLAARGLVFVLCLAGVGALALAAPRFRPIVGSSLPRFIGRRDIRLSRTEWAVALGLVDLLFAAFVAVQLTVLFAGHEYVLSSTGLTYAEYARQGFAQLVAASGLTLLVVAAAVWICDCAARRDRLVLKILLGLLCLLTLAVLASALKRLLLYEQAFGFTRPRLLAHAIMLWLAALFLLILVAGALGRSGWLPRTALAVSVASVLALGAADPDRLIAGWNIDRYSQTGKLDLEYLEGLSPDALPAVRRLPEALRTCVLQAMAARLPEREPWYSYNVRRSAARSALSRFSQEARGLSSDPLCNSLLATPR